MGSGSTPGSLTLKRLAGRSLYAVGSGLVAGSRLVAKGVGALTADTSDKEPIRFLKFALLEWGSTSNGGGGGFNTLANGSSGGGSGSGGSPHHELPRLPVLLVGLSTGFQVGAAMLWFQPKPLHASASAVVWQPAVVSSRHRRPAMCCSRGRRQVVWHPAPAPALACLPVCRSCCEQVWRLDGANPAELLSRRDGPVK